MNQSKSNKLGLGHMFSEILKGISGDYKAGEIYVIPSGQPGSKTVNYADHVKMHDVREDYRPVLNLEMAFDKETIVKVHQTLADMQETDVAFMMRHDAYLHQKIEVGPYRTGRKMKELKKLAALLNEEQLTEIVYKSEFSDKVFAASHELRKRKTLHPQIKE